jgi:hypothetical protein
MASRYRHGLTVKRGEDVEGGMGRTGPLKVPTSSTIPSPFPAALSLAESGSSEGWFGSGTPISAVWGGAVSAPAPAVATAETASAAIAPAIRAARCAACRAAKTPTRLATPVNGPVAGAPPDSLGGARWKEAARPSLSRRISAENTFQRVPRPASTPRSHGGAGAY